MEVSKTLRIPVALAMAIVFVACVHSDPSADQKCSPPDPMKTVNLTIEWGRKEGSNWLTEFTLRGGPEQIAELKSLDISQTVLKCNGEDVVQIRGILRGVIDASDPVRAKVEIVKERELLTGTENVEEESETERGLVATEIMTTKEELPITTTEMVDVKSVTVIGPENTVINTTTMRPMEVKPKSNHTLVFYEKTGPNIKLSRDGRTATRVNASRRFGGGSLITNRPLQYDEMFEVRLDRVVPEFGRSISIGVTTHSPSTVRFLNHWYWGTSGIWIYYLNNIFHNGMDVTPGYGINLEKLRVGHRVGLVRKRDGHLEFYVNGRNQGPARVNVTGTVYGIMDLFGSAVKATILRP